MWWYHSGFWGWGWWPFHAAISVLFWLVLVGLIAAALRASRRPPPYPDQPAEQRRGLAILEERYARGEIQRDEYLQKKADLQA